MHQDNLAKVAKADNEAMHHASSIGYAVNLVIDYGSGRQQTISGTLPLGCSREVMDAELDRLRLATNRQRALQIIFDTKATRIAALKTREALLKVVDAYKAEMAKELEGLKDSPNANKTMVIKQIEAVKLEASNYERTKKQEIAQLDGDIAKCEAVIAYYEEEAKK